MPAKPFIYFVFAPVAVIPLLRQFAKQFGDGGDAELDNFKMELCVANDPAHTIVAMGGSTGPVGEYTVSILETLIDNGTIPPSVMWARVHNEPNPKRIAATSHAPTQTRIDNGETVYWDLNDALQKTGMIMKPMPL